MKKITGKGAICEECGGRVGPGGCCAQRRRTHDYFQHQEGTPFSELCVTCLHSALESARKELADEKAKTAVYQHAPDAGMAECDCYYCTLKELEKAEKELAESRERIEELESELRKRDGN